MSKHLNTPTSADTQSIQFVKASRDGSQVDTTSSRSDVRAVTPTSERIIKETSEKRRKAMVVLANR